MQNHACFLGCDLAGATFRDTLRSQIEGYTRLLMFRKFPIFPLLLEPTHLLIFKKISSLPVFHLSTQMIFSILPVVIRAYLLIKFEEKFQPTLLLET